MKNAILAFLLALTLACTKQNGAMEDFRPLSGEVSQNFSNFVVDTNATRWTRLDVNTATPQWRDLIIISNGYGDSVYQVRDRATMRNLRSGYVRPLPTNAELSLQTSWFRPEGVKPHWLIQVDSPKDLVGKKSLLVFTGVSFGGNLSWQPDLQSLHNLPGQAFSIGATTYRYNTKLARSQWVGERQGEIIYTWTKAQGIDKNADRYIWLALP